MAGNKASDDANITTVPSNSSSNSIQDTKDEKSHVIDVDINPITGDIPNKAGTYDDLKEELEDVEDIDWYKPFPIMPGQIEEPHILTIRALVVGIVLGSLTVCSNVYLGKFPGSCLRS